MALQISAGGQVVFFAQVFGQAHAVTAKAKALVAAGVKFEVSLYTLRAVQQGKLLGQTLTLTVGTSSLMKQSVPPPVFAQNAKLIQSWVWQTYALAGSPAPVEEGLTPPVLPSVPVPSVAQPKPVNEVIALKQAEALGQKVHGTSSGSVYHTIALSDHVKLAARIYKGGAISIRAEWTDNPKAELQKLQEAGLQMKAEYGSIHFDSAQVPVQRVIGAFLMGTGIQWQAVVTNGADLVVMEKS